jgi:hypothetical protein
MDMHRVAHVVLFATLLLASVPALAQNSGQFYVAPLPSALPPSVTLAPGAAPNPGQQLQIQNYRNQLELAQQPSATLGPQGFGNQLNAAEQLNQLNLQSR